MSWKKNVFSNLMWAAYTLLTGVGLVELSIAAVQVFRGPSYMGPVLALVLAAVMAGWVFLVHRIVAGRSNSRPQKGVRLLLWESASVIFFLIAGSMFRAYGISAIGSGGVYYDAAMVAAGQSVPRMVHGAVYLYLQLLHLVFLLVGNKLAAGIWLQVILHLLAGLLLYIGVRKLAGVLPAQVMLCFLMFAEPVVQSAQVLSPEPFFLLLLAVGIVILAMCRSKANLPVLFLPAGLWTGIMGYLDIGGFFLLLLAVAIILADWNQETSLKEKGAAFGLYLAGGMAGFFGAFLVDSLLSGKSFARILDAWLAVYGHGAYGFNVSNLADGLYWEGPLLALMGFGVFSYWRSREKQYISMWMLMVCVVAIIRYNGLFTDELPSAMYLIISLAVLAGVGIRASFCKDKETSEAVQSGRSEQTSAGQEDFDEDLDEEIDDAPIKLPKYLCEPGSDQITIPKYLQEEATASKPKSKPQVIPVTPVSAEPETPAAEVTETPVAEPETPAAEVMETPVAEPKMPVVAEKDEEILEEEVWEESPATQYIENPLPLPKPHEKKVMEYNVGVSAAEDDYDYPVDDNDDFDIL